MARRTALGARLVKNHGFYVSSQIKWHADQQKWDFDMATKWTSDAPFGTGLSPIDSPGSQL